MTNIALDKDKFAAIYARKSSQKESNSIPAQLTLGVDMARNNSLIVYDTYWDEESATKFSPTHRKGFRELLKDAENGKFGTLIAFRRDRLARNADDFIFIRNLLRNQGIRILYSNPGEFQPSDDEKSLFVDNILMAIDELEPKVIQERAEAGRREKRQRREISFNGRPPYGYYQRGTDKAPLPNNNNTLPPSKTIIYATDEEKSLIIQKIFITYLNAEDNMQLKDFVSQVQSFPEISLEDKKLFSRNKVVEIIINYAYAGLMFADGSLEKHGIKREDKIRQLFTIEEENNDIRINKGMLVSARNIPNPIIDEETWLNAAIKWFRLSRKPSRSRKNYLFHNMLICGTCNRRISLVGSRYRCETSTCTSIKEDTLEPLILNHIISDLISTDSICDYCNEAIAKKKQLKSKRTKELSKTKEVINKLIIQLLDNSNRYDIEKAIEKYAHKEQSLQESIIRLERKIRAINDFVSNKDRLIEITEKCKNDDELAKLIISYCRNNLKEFQILLNSIIKRVIVNGKEKSEQRISIEYNY